MQPHEDVWYSRLGETWLCLLDDLIQKEENGNKQPGILIRGVIRLDYARGAMILMRESVAIAIMVHGFAACVPGRVR